MTKGTSDLCPWCEKPFRARRGGSPQRFCGAKCRSAFWSALRRWGDRAVATGILSIADIRNGDAEACTLLLTVGSLGTVGEAHGHRSAPIEPHLESRYSAQRNLERLMAQAIAARRR
jgi:hypothetical protein